jgi:hypothetical protein
MPPLVPWRELCHVLKLNYEQGLAVVVALETILWTISRLGLEAHLLEEAQARLPRRLTIPDHGERNIDLLVAHRAHNELVGVLGCDRQCDMPGSTRRCADEAFCVA